MILTQHFVDICTYINVFLTYQMLQQIEICWRMKRTNQEYQNYIYLALFRTLQAIDDAVTF